MKGSPTPRGGLSVAALAVVLLVPFTVGWLVERVAYGEARATEAVVAPLRAVVPHGAATVKMAGVQSPEGAPAIGRAAEPAAPAEQVGAPIADAAPKH